MQLTNKDTPHVRIHYEIPQMNISRLLVSFLTRWGSPRQESCHFEVWMFSAVFFQFIARENESVSSPQVFQPSLLDTA